MSLQTNFNIRISGTSYDSVVDTGVQPITVSVGNSDKIGHATFALSNVTSGFYGLLNSGNPLVQIAFNSSIVFRGTAERIDQAADTIRGTYTVVNCFDYAQELLNALSPDGKPTSEEGLALFDGMDLVAWTSGVNLNSGAQVGQLFRQYFGINTDTAGLSGFTFKKHSGTGSVAVWRSYFNPDGTRDNNYYIRTDELKVTREYAWDTIRRITRGGTRVIDGAGNPVTLDLYIDTSGGINLLTSGHTNFIASGVRFQLFGLSSGAGNNVIRASIPSDLTAVKNVVIGWFPIWTQYPLDGDYLTDIVAYSGVAWSGINPPSAGMTTTLSGNAAAGSVGFISIMGMSSGGASTMARMIYTHPGSGNSINISKFNVANGGGVKLVGNYRFGFSGDGQAVTGFRNIAIWDTSGDGILKSGSSSSNNIKQINEFVEISDTVYNTDGTFNSGTGGDGGWAATATFPDLTRVKQIQVEYDKGGLSNRREIWVDNFRFTFNYNFSPLTVTNNNSASLYGRRYETFEYPYLSTDGMASGIITNELNSKLGSRGFAEVTIKENRYFSGAQFVRPGQVVIFDAPSLGTGSGFRLHFWKVVDTTMTYSHARGFTTDYKLVPWYSGTLTDPETNLINFTTPEQYAPAYKPRRPTLPELMGLSNPNKVMK